MPLTRQREWTLVLSKPRPRFPLAVFELQSGIAWGGFSEHVHRPPILGNTVVLGGQFMKLAAGALPPPRARPVIVRNGIANGLRRRPVSLGSRTWSGLHGELSLTPSVYPAHGELTDLVLFRWRDQSGAHAVGINVWEPLTAAVATLRVIVVKLAPQRAPQQPRLLSVVDGVPIATTPRWLTLLCQAPPLLRLLCPSRIPAGGAQFVSVDLVPTPLTERPKLSSLLVSLSWGGESGDPRRNRPPAFVHLELRAGGISTAGRFAPSVPLARLKVPRGYALRRPIFLGHRDWTRRPGELVFGDCYGNHLYYRWLQGGRTYQLDLHAWEPVTETADVLREIVRSRPAARR